MQHHISVAEAAAILNVAIIIVQITYPLLITLVTIGIVKRRTNVATWSVFGRLINQSHWPFLLQTDTVAGAKVDKRIRGIALSSALTTLLLAVAAIITPLGLHSTLRSTDIEQVEFQYVKDTSAMGQATQYHGGYNTSRTCERRGQNVPCPGNDDGVAYTDSSTADTYSYSILPEPGREGSYITSGIARNITDVFTSVTSSAGSTIASIFDIQYRSFVTYNNQTNPGDDGAAWIDHGRPRTQGRFRYYQQFLLENKTRAIEGLIVATGENPGIGFRNHTLPPSSTYGYSWTEQILWLEPETECTALNLTYDYTIPAPDEASLSTINPTLVDRGGFINLPERIPVLDLNDTQGSPRYLERSHSAAVATLFFLSRYMNLTRSGYQLGTRYNMSNYEFTPFSGANKTAAAPNQLVFSAFGAYDTFTNTSDPSLPGPLRSLRNQSILTYGDGTVNIGPLVHGYAGGDPINITTIGGAGGLILGIGSELDAAGNPVQGSDAWQLVPGSNWSQPIFSCVSGISASVKNVDFQLNGTASLENLVVRSVRPVEYSANDLPIWAMENSGRNMSQLAPFWGRVTEEAARNADVSTLRQADFRLPAGMTSVDAGYLSIINDAVAGLKSPLAGLLAIFSDGSTTTNGIIQGVQDYTGGSNYLIYLKWRELLSNSSTTGKVVDFIWTDLMANMLVSAKSTLSTPATDNLQRRDTAGSATSIMRPASQYSIGISYDWRYAIPALLFICLYIVLLAWSVVMFMTRGLSISILRFMLNQTAAGRSITTERHQASSDIDVAPTAVWARVKGDEIVRVGKDTIDNQHLGGSGGQEYYPLEPKNGMQHSSEHAGL